jgi:hypothetical protein
MLLKGDPPDAVRIALVRSARGGAHALILANRSARPGLPADLGYSGNMGKRMSAPTS